MIRMSGNPYNNLLYTFLALINPHGRGIGPSNNIKIKPSDSIDQPHHNYKLGHLYIHQWSVSLRVGWNN